MLVDVSAETTCQSFTTVLVPMAILSPTFMPVVLTTEHIVAVATQVPESDVIAGEEVIPE